MRITACFGTLFLLAIAVFIAGCGNNSQGRLIDPIIPVCVAESGERMSLLEAEEIASRSECERQGTIGEMEGCNNITATYWLGFNPREPNNGCNPACVVDLKTKTASINWRCTGLINPFAKQPILPQ